MRQQKLATDRKKIGAQTCPGKLGGTSIKKKPPSQGWGGVGAQAAHKLVAKKSEWAGTTKSCDAQ